MDEAAITRFITETFADVHVASTQGGSFFMGSADDKLPFATIVTSDAFDQASELDRPGVFRLNVGVSKATFDALFAGQQDHDPTALDRLFPHPVYGSMSWVSVINPSDDTFATRVRPLLEEAFRTQAARKAKRANRE